MSLFLRLNDTLDRHVRHAMLTQPAALAFALSSYADAESAGESQVFERCLARASDPRVRAMIRRHQEDEIRHAALLDARRVALELPRYHIPAHLKVVDLLSAAAGGVLELPMDEDRHVALAYHLLYVVEARAVDEFDRATAAFEATGDRETAALFASIRADETRHLRYCDAIARKFSTDAAEFDRDRARMVDIERRVYGAQTRAFTLHMLREGIFVLPEPWDSLLGVLLFTTNLARLPAPPALVVA